MTVTPAGPAVAAEPGGRDEDQQMVAQPRLDAVELPMETAAVAGRTGAQPSVQHGLQHLQFGERREDAYRMIS